MEGRDYPNYSDKHHHNLDLNLSIPGELWRGSIGFYPTIQF